MGLMRDIWEVEQHNRRRDMEIQEDLQREIIDSYKAMLAARDAIDTHIQQMIASHRKNTVHFASNAVNFNRFLRKLADAPQETLEAHNMVLKQRGKESVTWEEAVEYATNTLANIRLTEETWRKGILERFKEVLTIVEKNLQNDKGDLSDCSSIEERNIVRELVNRDQKEKADLLKIISEIEIEAAGRKGEEAVEYAIKWLKPEGYRSIAKDCLSKYGSVSIILKNADYIDEAQEFDHIVIGENGIFIIETKNYAGVISVSAEGDWIQEKDGVCKGIKNPVQQCNRHHGIIKSIVGNVPITSIICIANDSAIIKGRENCEIPIVKVELLQDFIKRVKTERQLSEPEIEDIIKKIQVKKKSEPLKCKKEG